MKDACLEVRRDAVRNLVGRLAGARSSAPALMTGSHTDTVGGGGRFDGVVGVLAAIEVARSNRAPGTPLSRDLLVVDFLGEEPNDFGLSCLGSRSMAREMTAADLGRRDGAGRTLAAAYEDFGLDPSAVLQSSPPGPGPLHAFVELHIEQGPALEQGGQQIGVVTSVCGIERFVAHFAGREDRARTRPVADRQDAMVAAAEAVLAVRREGCGAPGNGVATATHDAVHMAALAPMALIFVPSRDGRSHCPEEWTDPQEIGGGRPCPR